MAQIRIERLTKTFRGHPAALRNVSLSIERGEMVALIGPSGSGKSTLLRHIAGLVCADRAPEVGAIEVGGRRVQRGGRLAPNIRAIRTQIGFVFQQFNLVNRLSLLTNVLAGTLGRVPLRRAILGWFTAQETARALDALRRVGIAEYAYQRAGHLSGGQQQRASIARALMQQAQVILADEPIASLDPESARRVMETLARINREDGITVLVSLHQVDFALRYCRRIVALKYGEVVFDGPATALSPQVLQAVYGTEPDEGAGVEALLDRHPAEPSRELAPLLGAQAI